MLFAGEGSRFHGEWTSTLRRRSIVLFSISPLSAGLSENYQLLTKRSLGQIRGLGGNCEAVCLSA